MLYFVVTDSTKQWYLDNNQNYGHVNKDVLIKLDAQVDYSEYDNWTFGTNYNHNNRPDSIVDLIIMVYRENLESSMHPGNGIAALGYLMSDFTVENGDMTIVRDFPGSGVTLERGIEGRRTDWYAHEIGHLLFGAGHAPYNKEPSGFSNPAFWGLTIGAAYFPNAYERHRLRWVDYVDIQITDSLDVSVSDYVTSGDAYRIALPGASDEAFFIENHQELSYFDHWVNRNGPGKGLYIYHVKGTNSHPRYDMEIAEGRFDWLNPFWILNPWGSGQPGDSIPVFVQDKPNRKGYDGRDAVPHSKGGIFKIYVTDNDRNGQWEPTLKVFGNEMDAFKVGYNQIFSPWSNPNSHRWDDVTPSGITLEILNTHTGIQGEDIYNLRIRMVNGENGPSSNPLLISLENYSSGGNQGIKLTWAENDEPDIAGYEVYRQIESGSIDKISGSSLVTDTTWVHWGVVISPGSPTDHTYYVKAVDTQSKKSNFSNGLHTTVQYVSYHGEDKIIASGSETELGFPKEYVLEHNYPNPFNPTTTIQFALPEKSRVQITVYNIAGELITTLINGEYPAGYHRVIFDASGLTSGIYLYRLKAGNPYPGKPGSGRIFVETRKMMVLK